MTAKLVTVDGVTRSIKGWAQAVGLHRDTLYDRLSRGWDFRTAIKTPAKACSVPRTYKVECDTETDTLCESGEPDRRVIVYGMVCCGTTDAGIVEATGYDAAEVAKFRAELPAWWPLDMRRHKEFDENSKGVGK